MGPEVRFKSARRYQGTHRHQGNRCIDAATRKQSFLDSGVFRTFFQFLGISSWEIFMWYGRFQALHTYTGYLTYVTVRFQYQHSLRVLVLSISKHYSTSSSINSSPLLSPSSFCIALPHTPSEASHT